MVAPPRKNEVFLMAIAEKKKIEIKKKRRMRRGKPWPEEEIVVVSDPLESPSGTISILIGLNLNSTLSYFQNLKLEMSRLNQIVLKIKLYVIITEERLIILLQEKDGAAVIKRRAMSRK